MWSGVPALRHDWGWPLQRGDFAGWFQIAGSGWSPFGIGTPTEHIERYLLAIPVTLCGLAAGGRIALFVYALAVGYALASAGAALARRFAGGDALVAAGVAAFLLFSPWTYTQVVAGHIEMILASAGIAGMLSRLTSEPRAGDANATSLYVVLAYSQLQFFCVALLLTVAAALLRRGRLPLLTAVAIGMPTFLGLSGNFGALAQTPTAIPWQLDQSLEPGSAWRLLGYFTGYADAYSRVSWALAIVCAVACAGIYVERARPAARAYALAIPLLLLLVTGLRGPVASLYERLLLNFPPVGVFRELYDFSGLLAICYAALAAAGAARVRVLRPLLALASCALLATWLGDGITRWWVPAERLPAVAVDVAAGQRYALTPAFQPLRFGSLGSGADPDATYRAGGIVALNEYDLHYPDDTALARFEASGATHDLEALGTAAVYPRPWLTSANVTAQREPVSLENPLRASLEKPLRLTHAVPLVSLLPVPAVTSTGERLAAGNVFFGDVAGLTGPDVPPAWQRLRPVRPLEASKADVDPDRNWVDARFEMVSDPEIAQAFGGVFTTSRQTFQLDGSAHHVLAFVRGRLYDDRAHVLGASAPGYRWLALPLGSRGIRCAGRCALALTGDPPAETGDQPAPAGDRLAQAGAPPAEPGDPAAQAAEPSAHEAEAVPAERRLPWLVTAHLPASAHGRTLRLNERYDAHWLAFAGSHLLTHVRLDATVNGWLGAPAGASEVIICNALALLQALFEVAATLWVVYLLTRLVLYSSP